MSKQKIISQDIEKALSELGKSHFISSESKINAKVENQMRVEKRHALLAIIGFFVAVLATIFFVFQKEPFGYFAMPLVIVVFLAQVLRSRNNARRFDLVDGEALLDLLQSDAQQNLKHFKYLGPWILCLFALLSTYVVYSHGVSSIKAWLYIGMTMLIGVYVLYRLFITVPELQRELEHYRADENSL